MANDERAPETPLDSWKAIADYLKRDVRTAMRWEKAERLPVHRHWHLTRSSVYAYPSELDAWRAARRPEKEIAAVGWLGPRTRRLAIAALLLLALMSPGGGRVMSPVGTAAQGRGMVVRQIWAGPGVDTEGTVSPDGRFLTFIDWDKDGGNVAVRNLATGEKRRLTNEHPQLGAPYPYGGQSTVSPDGTEVAYAWFNYPSPGHESFYDLRVVPFAVVAGGSPSRVLYRNEDVNYLEPFGWSPDGKEVLTLLRRKDATWQIALVSEADGSTRILKSLEWRNPSQAGFSGDGRYIVYDVPVRQGSPDRDIFILSADGRGEVPLVQHPAIDYAPVWTPDGTRILFASDRNGATGLWMIQVAAGKPQGTAELVKPDMGRMRPLGFSRDGSYYYGVATGTQDVYTADLDPQIGDVPGAPTRFTDRFLGSNLAGVWSPDGRQFAYFSRRGPVGLGPGSTALVIRSLDTGEERDFFPNLAFPLLWPQVQWFPDGGSLLLTAQDRGRESLHRMDARTGLLTPIGERLSPTAQGGGTLPALIPRISQDGRTVYHTRAGEGPEPASIMAYDIETGRGQQLFRSTGPLLDGLALSRDGKRLAFSDFVGLHVMPASGGSPHEIVHVEPGTRLLGIEWTDGDRFILFFKQDAKLVGSLLRVSPDGTAPSTALSMGAMELMFSPSLHPDGRRLAFTAGDPKHVGGEVWTMQNFLPPLGAAAK